MGSTGALETSSTLSPHSLVLERPTTMLEVASSIPQLFTFPFGLFPFCFFYFYFCFSNLEVEPLPKGEWFDPTCFDEKDDGGRVGSSRPTS